MAETKRVGNCEVLRKVGSEEVVFYCHACGQISGGASDWDAIDMDLFEELAFFHRMGCVGGVKVAES